MIDEVVGPYRVVRSLGAGGMGEVFLAEDPRLARPVALKLLRGDVCATDEKRRLLREARAASRLSHPSIAVVYDVGEADVGGSPRSFIAMELVDGPPLDRFVAEEKLAPAEIADLLVPVAEALAEAHATGVVHRDVKPSNVLVGPGRRAKLVDFGVATRLGRPAPDDAITWSRPHPDDTTVSAEAGDGLAGTVAYMSPEQAAGEVVDARSDVFSFGVLLYELLAGRRPFDGGTVLETLAAVMRREPARLETVAPHVPASLADLVARALEKDRERRLPSMSALAEGLRAVARGEAPGLEGRRVAVLSFANLTGRADEDWIGAGLGETLTNDLFAQPGVKVLPRARVAEARRRHATPDAADDDAVALRVGRETGAHWVVAGAFQRLGESVRVTARLLETRSGRVAKTVKLDGALASIFELQDRVAKEIGTGIAPGAPVAAVPSADETRVVEAFEAFSKGVLNLREESPVALDRAIVFFERALALDPLYTRAHYALGQAWDLKATYLGMPELLPRAERAFRRALELKPDFVQAWRELGAILVELEREGEGHAALARAVELAPDDARNHGAIGRAHFIGTGDFDASLAAYQRAVAMNPDAGWYALQLAHVATLVGDVALGEHWGRRAAALQEGDRSGREGARIVGGFTRLGHALAASGRHAEALEAYGKERKSLDRADHALRDRHLIEVDVRTGSALLKLGETEAAREALTTALRTFDRRVTMGADDPSTRYYAAVASTLLGDPELAWEHLKRAVAGRPGLNRERARRDPDLAELRRDPRVVLLLAEGKGRSAA